MGTRLRLQTCPPLPDLKTWFFLPSDASTGSILNLKRELCSQLAPLRRSRVSPTHLGLFLDDFELQDATPAQIIRDGDLILLRGHAPDPKKLPASTKRKRAPSTSSSSSFDIDASFSSGTTSPFHSKKSSASSTSSSSSSSSTSTSSSDSSSESSPPPARPTKKPRADTRPADTIHNHESLVPYGQGKASTKSRNQRRRLLREAKRKAHQPSGLSTSNAIPLGSAQPHRTDQQVTTEAALTQNHQPIVNGDDNDENAIMDNGIQEPSSHPDRELTMFSLRNKNKKKGFRKSIISSTSSKIPKKIIFSETSTASNSQIVHAPLVPPSEKQDLGLLPANVFVTWVDVEAPAESTQAVSRDQEWKQTEQQDVQLPNEEQGDGDNGDDAAWPGFDWNAAEVAFESGRVVDSLESLKNDDFIAWKELSINYETYCPEELLQIGRVSVTVDDDGSSNRLVSVKLIPRPFEPEDEEKEVQTFTTLDEITQRGCRNINIQ